MSRCNVAVALLAALSVAGAMLAGCAGPHPFIEQGDAKSVAIDYYGDVATTLPLAREHCAEYERVPRLDYTGAGVAYFDCIPP